MLLKHGLAGLTHKAAAAAGGLITSGLVAQYEMDNTTAPTTSTWRDEISSRDLVDVANTTNPAIVAGGTPTGEDYYEFGNQDGLVGDITGWGWPQDAEARTMFAVMRWASAVTHGYQGVMYGDPTTLEGWGLTCQTTTNLLVSDHWGDSIAGTAVNDDTWHVVANTYDTTDVRLYLDDVLDGGPTAKTLITSGTGLASINEALNATERNGFGIAAWLIYDRVLSGSEMTQMYNYLNDKYVTV